MFVYFIGISILLLCCLSMCKIEAENCFLKFVGNEIHPCFTFCVGLYVTVASDAMHFTDDENSLVGTHQNRFQ